MALFIMIFRKMMQNKWLEISLLLGLTIAVALVSSMPIYSEAILSRMLVKDLERQQQDTNKHSGSYWIYMGLNVQPIEQIRENLQKTEQFMRTEAAQGFHLPIKQLVPTLSTSVLNIVPDASSTADPQVLRSMNVYSSTAFKDHIKLVDGRMPSAQLVDGVYEVLVTEKTLNDLKTVLNNTFTINDKRVKETIKLKPVGVFEKKTDDDLYFSFSADLSRYTNAFMMDEKLFDQEFVQKGKLPLMSAEYYFVMDYTKMGLSYINDFLQTNANIHHWLDHHGSKEYNNEVVPGIETIKGYSSRASNLRILIWSLNVPVLIMLAFYMFMVSNMIMERQKTEIAVLRSRGAARWQIMLTYVIEGLLLGVVAYMAGMLLGLLLTKMVGASNGFLEFVDRAALTVHINEEAMKYGLAALLGSLVMMLIPAFLATRVSIVGRKQQMARLNKTPLWHKLFLDVIALAVAGYGLHMFRTRMTTLQNLGLGTEDLKIDPLQFIVPALFILGSGLLLLRLYPLLLRLVYLAGRKWWPPSLYATLIQVGRSSSQYQFLMVFLILTIATGVFSASAARTINDNTEDRVRYGIGADVVLQQPWPNDAPPPQSAFGPPQTEGAVPAQKPQRIHYEEPPFQPISTLPGVEQTAKVFVKPKASVSAGESFGEAILMAVDTDDFGRTAWLRNGLLAHSFYAYLNLIADNPKAVLISKTMAAQMKVKTGDTIYLGWDGIDKRSFIVYGIIDYFPTFNPNPADQEGKPKPPMLVVAQLQHVQSEMALEPYQVWLKLKPGVSMSKLYQAMKDRDIWANSIKDTRSEIFRAKNDPFLLSINGVLSLGFLISLSVSFIGFLLYWMLALRGRTLQNGILRAIGIPFRSLIGMLVAEQLLTSGAAIGIGMLTGNVASRLYVPVFQSAFDAKKLVPPFQVMFDAMDTMRLYTIVSVMLALGLGVLGYMLSRINMQQALKLGGGLIHDSMRRLGENLQSVRP